MYLLNLDICGPMQLATHIGFKYFITHIDDYGTSQGKKNRKKNHGDQGWSPYQGLHFTCVLHVLVY
jgi:hypothetical protein